MREYDRVPSEKAAQSLYVRFADEGAFYGDYAGTISLRKLAVTTQHPLASGTPVLYVWCGSSREAAEAPARLHASTMPPT